MKNKWKPVIDILKWIVAVGLTFVYVMLIQLIISFLFLSVIHMNIHTMLKVAAAVSVIIAIVYPLIGYFKKNK